MLTRRTPHLRDERGVMLVLVGIVLPLLLIIGAMVVSVGSWFTHAKHLQTKVDAGAFAGGGSWAFPCGPDIDARIEDSARQYFGQHVKADGASYTTTTFNPQVGQVQGDQLHVVLNGLSYYDGDSNPSPADTTDPTGPICASNVLDVKGTEENSPLLWGWLPFAPDLKRKARIEIFEAEGISGIIPIAVRAPEPVSVAAVFYNEGTGNLLGVKYFVKNNGIPGIPTGLQGWSTYNKEDSTTWASFPPTTSTGVAIAISFRGACDTNLPNPNTTIVTSPAPCFEDSGPGLTTVNQLCNQGGASQILNCYFASGTWPSESVQSGLHFIRGYPTGDVGEGRPALRSAWLENLDCPSGAYFNSINQASTCQVKLTVKIDIGSKTENPLPNPPNTPEQTRIAANTEVKYCLVLRGQTGNNACNGQFGTAEELNGTGGPGEVTFSTAPGKHLVIPRGSNGAAVAIQIRMKDTSIAGVPGCNLTTNNNFSNQCRFFYTGAGFTSTSQEPSGAAVLAAPVQRAFRGNSVSAGSVQWLRATTDQNCDGVPEYIDLEAASQPTDGNRCFFMDMGLKGGLAKDADDPVTLFDDGSGSSQMGGVDCDPNINQGQVLIEGVKQGCAPWYAKHPFDWTPACPTQNDIFTEPNPGPPWDDGRWPPLRCIKTRTTSQSSQLERGFDGRLFGDENADSCPTDGTDFVKGRNYWKQGTNLSTLYGYKDDSPARDTFFHPSDPRLVTIFLGPSEAFTGSGQNTYPIAGFIEVYVTGYGKITGNGNLTVDDPCPGQPPPTDLDCQGAGCGYAVWGHIINYALPNPNATPSGVHCNPGGSVTPCVPALVE